MSATQKPHETTPLEARLVRLIADNGPIPISEFMSDALCHPQHGYYATRDPFGAEGDFTTAPEVSQVFGELVGAWLVHGWSEIGEPSAFNLVELGPGRGTLMADILRVGKVRPGFLKAASVYLVEASGKMRFIQQRRLQAAGHEPVWADRLEDVPAGPTLIVANEFFDCLPIRQFVRTSDRSDTPWRERMVSVSDDGRLCLVLAEEALPEPVGTPRGAGPEAVFETCATAQTIAGEIASRFTSHKGRALVIDYGHGRPGLGDTFQAVRGHAPWPVLATPGEADVTAHVDFSALSRAARAAGARVDGPVLQRDFLERLGIERRLAKVMEAATPEAARDLKAGAERLVDRAQMGELFKVMAISTPGLGEPAGFS